MFWGMSSCAGVVFMAVFSMRRWRSSRHFPKTCSASPAAVVSLVLLCEMPRFEAALLADEEATRFLAGGMINDDAGLMLMYGRGRETEREERARRTGQEQRPVSTL
jgi:hypothetical protein